jgi:Protein of unknown function (DUF998)
VIVLNRLVLFRIAYETEGQTMSAIAGSTQDRRERRQDCSTAGNITRSLLSYLALAGPFYVLVSLAQALTRHGFSLARDEWSLLALGHLGWIQQANLILTGMMIIAGAVGVRRKISRFAPAGTWAPRLLVGYGLGLIGAGIFRADAADGFPPGTPTGRAAHISAHGMLHLLFGSLGFACLIAACFVIARSYHRRAARRAAAASRVVGVVFAAGFAGIATGAASEAFNLGFTAAVVISSAWLTAVAVDMYRCTRTAGGPGWALAQPAASTQGK